MSLKSKILEELNIDVPVLNIYPYGSHVYGTNNKNSDNDYVIVTKSLKLPSGGFKSNAISSSNRKIQGVLYSYSGFLNAIDNYDLTALECIFLPDSDIIEKSKDFLIRKWNQKDMINSIIKKASNSFYIADQQSKEYSQKDKAKKGIFHSIRVLRFGVQLKNFNKIVDYTESQDLKKYIDSIKDEDFDTRQFIKMRDELIRDLRDQECSQI